MKIKKIGDNSINETGGAKLSRLYHFMNSTEFFILSAFRSEFTREENLKRTNQLINKVRNRLGHGGIQLVGHWVETLENGNTNKVEELSFFVPLLAKANLTPSEFLDFAIKLAKEFNQEALLFGDKKFVNAIETATPYVFVKIGNTNQLTQKDLGYIYSGLKKRRFTFQRGKDEKDAISENYYLQGIGVPTSQIESLKLEYLGTWV
jgi:hypothetical protein